MSVVVTRENVDQLDAFKAIADRYGAQLRLTRLRPSGAAPTCWDELSIPRLSSSSGCTTGCSSGGGGADRRLVLPSRRLWRAAAGPQSVRRVGRVVYLVDPIGDVCACPFAIHDAFLVEAASAVGGLRDGVARVRASSRICASRRPAAHAPVVLAVRRLPRRLHGCEVLHRAAARRPGPGVRAGSR